MDSRATSIDARRRARRQAGATMVEFVFALGVGLILLAVCASFALFQTRSFAVMLNLVDMDQLNRNALDKMTREVRQVNKVTAYWTNSIDFQDYDNVTLTYQFSAGAGTLSRIKGGTTTVLLTQIESFTFAMMQRNIVDGSYAYYPAETIEECKVLGLTWETSRSIMGRKTSLSGNQMARIVIRKQ